MIQEGSSFQPNYHQLSWEIRLDTFYPREEDLDIWCSLEVGKKGSDIEKAKYLTRSHPKIWGIFDGRRK